LAALRISTLALVLLTLALPGSALAADQISDARQLTAGQKYDRNPSVVVDPNGEDVWVFFARSQTNCDRLTTPDTCDPDQLPTNLPVPGVLYDLYARHSEDGGATFGPSFEVAPNPGVLMSGFRGRTVAATQTANGDIHVFWANGGSGDPVKHYRKDAAGTTFDPGTDLPGSHFNVEAIADGADVLVYTERADGTGIDVRRLAGTTYGPPEQVTESHDRHIPKVARDASGTYRMVSVSGGGAVYRLSSDDGVAWGPQTATVAQSGSVRNWDPTIGQAPDGRFFLFHAPDQGDGSQRIEFRTSTDFADWSAPTVLTTGTQGASAHWDFWPEAAVIGGKLTVFYASERPDPGEQNAGTAHIYSQTIAPEPTPPPADADADGDGLPDVADCDPNDASQPARNGTDADCDGSVDPQPVQTVTTPQQPQPQGQFGVTSLCGAGTTGDDLIVCGGEHNTLTGLTGADRIFGGDGNDTLNGGDGDDVLVGSAGNDALNGQRGDDSLDGGTGLDRLSGGDGEDSLVGGTGNDRLSAGRGNDVVRGGSGTDTVNVRDRRPGDVVSCGSGSDVVVADRGDVVSRDCERRTIRR
jgi:hypothetical protein